MQGSSSISERHLALIAYEVLKIIKACHDVGLLHGDIKPANFCLKHKTRNPLFSNDSSVNRLPWLKAIDFGCSQHLGRCRELFCAKLFG